MSGRPSSSTMRQRRRGVSRAMCASSLSTSLTECTRCVRAKGGLRQTVSEMNRVVRGACTPQPRVELQRLPRARKPHAPSNLVSRGEGRCDFKERGLDPAGCARCCRQGNGDKLLKVHSTLTFM